MNRDFLKEAIADAKAVKESAIANAKVALEEAFSPQVQAMFASKLEEMEKEDVKEADKEVKEAKSDDEVKEEMSNPVMRRGLKGDDPAEKETEKMRFKEEDDKKVDESKEDVSEEDKELDEIISELEKEDLKEDARTDAEEEGYKDGMKDAKKDIEDKLDDIKLEEDERTDAEEEGFKDGMKDEKEDEEDEDIDLDDLSEEDLKKFIEDVIEDMVKAGEIEAGEEFEDDVDVDVSDEGEIEVEDDMETSVDIAEDARTDAEEEGYKDGIKDAKADAKKAIDKIKLEEKEEELKEAYATVKTLRKELNEINLLNAKLLYTNKVFRGKNLTESQKVKVLGAFDKAETIKEVKLVFETIDGSVKSKVSNKSISEGFRAKGSASNMKANTNVSKKQPIVESDEMVARFKKLAGII
jgi:hypothetical protein|tara:strand:- start:148 stop:1380 length:1233 start_codon:yes stop_codon:yes gene_type:complete